MSYNNPTAYQCRICGYFFPSQAALDNHVPCPEEGDERGNAPLPPPRFRVSVVVEEMTPERRWVENSVTHLTITDKADEVLAYVRKLKGVG